jgi:membrane protein YqaA with SNARE-associated domain
MHKPQAERRLAIANETPQKAIIQTVVTMLLLLGGCYLGFSFFRTEIISFGQFIADYLGLLGSFLFVFVVDSLIVPMTVDVLFVTINAWAPIPFLLTISMASILAGLTGYWIGRLLLKFPFFHRTVTLIRHKTEPLVKRYGFMAIVLAALTPIPYSLISWSCGILKMKYWHFAIGCLFRLPRMFIYYYIIQWGISLANQNPLLP